ncbi:hypothetical protein PHYPSEUDO_004637 [Phytophthora pseudosyringae]|uniref:Uncharacterized protein n=1 Tax=Phytophthora pseudosyringae TaxID=221518 RepID=A0A8T1VMZ5_9STRA|nr:hypothetical protein PHYPSEUDO_004637 [Phytophthora pseudosyringae]
MSSFGSKALDKPQSCEALVLLAKIDVDNVRWTLRHYSGRRSHSQRLARRTEHADLRKSYRVERGGNVLGSARLANMRRPVVVLYAGCVLANREMCFSICAAWCPPAGGGRPQRHGLPKRALRSPCRQTMLGASTRYFLVGISTTRAQHYTGELKVSAFGHGKVD